MIVVENLHTSYGHIEAVKGISFEVRRGEITAIIGANGAGKSTTIKTICGILHPREGKIELNGTPIQRLGANEVVRLGVGYVPEGRRVFPVMTLDENLDMGAYHRSDQAEIAKDKARMYEYFPALKGREKQLAGSLSGGEQQMLAIARGLMLKPKLLMLDEPSLGLMPTLISNMWQVLGQLRQTGYTILLVEQNVRKTLQLADRAYVLQNGKIILSGPASELINDDTVRRAYLGV